MSRQALLEELRTDPGRTAILTDVDGTLAPIVARPEMASVPARAGELLERLAGRYAIVACISGRQAEEARRLVGAPALAYAGNHGLELLLPGDEEARLDPAVHEHAGEAADLVAGLDRETLAEAGVRVEDKGPIQALHWRGADDEHAAQELAEEIAAAAERRGLTRRRGRKVLELRPPGGGKDEAVTGLLGGRGVRAAVYAGDDRTDLDAFQRLRELRNEGHLDTAVCVGIASAEGPPELAREADLVVDGLDGWLAILDALAR